MAKVLFLGNGINNVDQAAGYTWKDLLKDLIDFAARQSGNRAVRKIDLESDKPFHLLYEEIIGMACCGPQPTEIELKEFIAAKAERLPTNEIYTRIGALGVSDLITTNYEPLLIQAFGGEADLTNHGVVKESTYGIFRHRVANGTRLWYIHGYADRPRSIILGYEQYSGMLQRMRDYVVTGPAYEKFDKPPLTKRIQRGSGFQRASWIDLFLLEDVHILGFKLDYAEMDLWWLLTYRSRLMSRGNVARTSSVFRPRNNVYYYIPDEYVVGSKAKLELLAGIGVHVVKIKSKDKLAYYRRALDRIQQA